MKEALLSLSPSELRALAASLRSGRMSAPYTVPTLSRYVDQVAASAVAESLQKMCESGMQPTGAAHALDLLAASITERPAIGELIDLVTTGPASIGIANRDTSVVVSDLFRNAGSTVLIAGYTVYGGRRVFQALGERMTACPTLQVRMFLDIQRKSGDTSASSELVKRFVHQFRTVEWPAGAPMPEIYYDPRSLVLERDNRAVLHAKCVVVDAQEIFVSSANFTEAAQQRNVEVGVLLSSGVVANRLISFFDTLLDAHHFLRAV